MLPAGSNLEPSVYQRRLWQKERQLEDDVMQINLMIASSYLSEMAAARKHFLTRHRLILLWKLKVVLPSQRRIHRMKLRMERFKRSAAMKKASLTIAFIYLYWALDNL